MRATITVIFGLALILVFSSQPSDAKARDAARVRFKSGAGPPPVDAPREIWDAWLRFHEAELCQGLDTIFVFHKKGVEIWCRVEDEKAYQKFSDILSPLRADHEIGLYTTRPPAEKTNTEEKNPPPSLWNNNELRIYLGDPFARNRNLNDEAIPNVAPSNRADYDFMLKQRMMMFADQILDWDRRMKRYSGDLPALADAAFNPALPREIRKRAAAICLAHSHAVDKLLEKLGENLAQALPKGTKKSSSAPEEEKPEPAASTPRDVAIKVAESAQSLARRIYYFIHPTRYTVGLTDLREPSLLGSLRNLRRMVSVFQRTLEPSSH